MTEIAKNNIETNEKVDFLKDSYFVWDSLSVWITHKYWKIDWNVQWWKQTSWMLSELQKNEAILKNKKVMFLLWGTNDVFSNKSAAQIIANIDKMAEIAKRNWVKIVIWTIPPFTPWKKEVEKALKKLNSTSDKLFSVIDEVNNHIKSKYDYIDYYSLVSDPAKRGIDPKYEAKNGWDGIHMFNAYSEMSRAQKQKFSEIIWNKNPEKWDLNSDFEKYFSDNIWKQKWFLELSQNEQIEMKKLYEKKYNIEKKIISYNSKRMINEISNSDLEKMNYNEKMDAIERQIELLNSELYDIELKIAKPELDKDAAEKAGVFKADMQNPDFKKMSDYIEWKDLKDITSWELYTLKLIWYDLSKLFLMWSGITSREKIKVWDNFVVNFWYNKNLNKNIWIWDLLPIDKIDKIKVNWVIWERKYSPRPGYYDEKWRYLSIYDNYKIQIISEKKYWKEEEENYKQAFQERYAEIRTPELVEMIYDYDGTSKDLHKLTKEEFQIVTEYWKKYFSNEIWNLDIDYEKQTISSKNWKNISDIMSTPKTKELWRKYLKYEKEIDRVIAKYPQVWKENLIRLINKENAAWDPLKWSTVWTSAYWLWQITKWTWQDYWKWLNRNNPEHQLEATCRILVDKMKEKKCNIYLALAYYNTGSGIMKISDSTLRSYYSKNPAISKRIPSWTPVSREAYFTAAVSYYNDLSYAQAKELIW